ncbi:MAG: hypothetical protein KIT11_05520 [Fimbriimonadaceae bacterium]|nr:hypothetical protein [Fimbriimonadaceae bacterium]
MNGFSEERLKALAEAAQLGDRNAEAAFVQAFWDVCLHEARDFRIPGVDLEDAHAIALHACVLAARTYTPGRGSKVESYTKILVRRAFCDEARRQATVSRSASRDALSLDRDDGDGPLGDRVGCNDPGIARLPSASHWSATAGAQSDRLRRLVAQGDASTVEQVLGWWLVKEIRAGRARSKDFAAFVRWSSARQASLFDPGEVGLPEWQDSLVAGFLAWTDSLAEAFASGERPRSVTAGVPKPVLVAVKTLLAERLLDQPA